MTRAGSTQLAEGVSTSQGRGRLLRDQQRALHAYERVKDVPSGAQVDYRNGVNALGTNIRSGGLAASMAALERLKERGMLLRQHIAASGIPGLEGSSGESLPADVRGLDLDAYILATREILKLTVWLKRAAQACFED